MDHLQEKNQRIAGNDPKIQLSQKYERLQQFIVLCIAIRRNYSSWTDFIENPVLDDKIGLHKYLKDSRLVFAAWLLDHVGLIRLNPDYEFINFPTPLCKQGNCVLVDISSTSTVSNKEMSKVWSELGCPELGHMDKRKMLEYLHYYRSPKLRDSIFILLESYSPILIACLRHTYFPFLFKKEIGFEYAAYLDCNIFVEASTAGNQNDLIRYISILTPSVIRCVTITSNSVPNQTFNLPNISESGNNSTSSNNQPALNVLDDSQALIRAVEKKMGAFDGVLLDMTVNNVNNVHIVDKDSNSSNSINPMTGNGNTTNAGAIPSFVPELLKSMEPVISQGTADGTIPSFVPELLKSLEPAVGQRTANTQVAPKRMVPKNSQPVKAAPVHVENRRESLAKRNQNQKPKSRQTKRDST